MSRLPASSKVQLNVVDDGKISVPRMTAVEGKHNWLGKQCFIFFLGSYKQRQQANWGINLIHSFIGKTARPGTPAALTAPGSVQTPDCEGNFCSTHPRPSPLPPSPPLCRYYVSVLHIIKTGFQAYPTRVYWIHKFQKPPRYSIQIPVYYFRTARQSFY